jgi:RteC protein
MKDYTSSLHKKLVDKLNALDEPGVPAVKRLTAKLDLVRRVLHDLKERLQQVPFTDATMEIDFFKYQKPLIVAERIFAFEKFTIESALPMDSPESANNFYEEELGAIRRFLRQYQFMYQYFVLDASDLDLLLFTRYQQPSGVLLPEVPAQDPDFSTAADYLFAKFIAYERLRDELAKRLHPQVDAAGTYTGRKLQWTGDISNLVELAYGIYGTMQINNGDVGVADIARWLEQSLNISLGRYYRTFAEIKMRKVVSRTRYIDHMQQTLKKQVEDGDAFVPVKPGPVPGSRK